VDNVFNTVFATDAFDKVGVGNIALYKWRISHRFAMSVLQRVKNDYTAPR
jgi:hypothetical protein